MARNVAYYIDPEEEERKRRQVEEAFGPPPPPPNLGVMNSAQLAAADVEAAKARSLAPAVSADNTDWDKVPEDVDSDEDLAGALDAMAEDPDAYAPLSPPEMARALAWKKAHGQPVPAGIEQQAPVAGEHPLDMFLTDVVGAANPYEEEAQKAAQLRKETTPAAVDKQAASVGDAQKGVPAKLSLGTDAGEELGWADELLEQVRSRVLNKPEATTTPLHQKAEDFASQSLDPREGFSRERASSRAAELYGDDEGPGRYWEDELLSRRNRITDSDVQKGFLLQSLMHGNDYGMQFRQMMRREQAGFEQDLGQARDKDFGNRRVSRGMAEAIAATGQISPEAAVKLRMNDPLVKNFGQFASQGGRAEGQALGREKAQMDHAFDLIRSDKTDDRTRGLAMLQSLTTLGSAEIRAQALSQMTPEQILALKGSWMASHLRVPKEVGEAVVAGDTSKLTPEQKERADKFRPVVESAAADARVRGRVVGDQVKEGAGAEVKQENAVLKSIALAQNDQKFAEKWQKDWHAAEMPLKQAIKGWSAMSPAGQKAFTQWTQTQQGGIVDFAHIGDQWNKYNLPPEDQVHASRVLEAINSYVKANAGSAVTGSEWDRIAHRTGLATGTWSPFNNPEVVGTFLRDSAAAMTQSRSDYERIMGGWK